LGIAIYTGYLLNDTGVCRQYGYGADGGRPAGGFPQPAGRYQQLHPNPIPRNQAQNRRVVIKPEKIDKQGRRIPAVILIKSGFRGKVRGVNK
jgi:hypothetical protein